MIKRVADILHEVDAGDARKAIRMLAEDVAAGNRGVVIQLLRCVDPNKFTAAEMLTIIREVERGYDHDLEFIFFLGRCAQVLVSYRLDPTPVLLHSPFRDIVG